MQLAQLARDLYKMGPAQRRALRHRFSTLAAPVLADARRRAGWSTRIPGAISVRPLTDMTRGRVGIALRVSLAEAPHGRAFEGLGQGGQFRHPVFGRDVWVSQPTRPYAFPAVRANEGRAAAACAAAADDAARECGFR